VGKLEEMKEKIMGARDDYWCKFASPKAIRYLRLTVLL
jgi:hypothetical protein